MATKPEEHLRLFFESRVVAAAQRSTGLILAIDHGATSSASSTADASVDYIQQVALRLCHDALRDNSECAWHSDELERLVPLDQGDGTGFGTVPVSGHHVPAKTVKDMPDWVWAISMGFARDRVIAYARVKAAMLNMSNISSSPELQEELLRVWGRANADLRATEVGLKGRTLTAPLMELRALRTQWLRTGEDVQNATRQQPTLHRMPVVTGMTAEEITARAADPLLEDKATFEQGETTLGSVEARDSLMGTETFVSFVFPASDHEEMYAAASGPAGLQTGERAYKMPALVTLHNTMGAVAPVASCLTEPKPYNVYFTADAATLLAELHSLIVTARKGPLTEDPPPALAPHLQRQYLLLEHGLL